MTATKKPAGKRVATLGELEHGTTKKFTMRRGGRDFEALLVNYQGNHFAYVNRCPHTGITLDWVNNQFFSSDNRYIMCATHGAVSNRHRESVSGGPAWACRCKACPS